MVGKAAGLEAALIPGVILLLPLRITETEVKIFIGKRQGGVK
jgi:hypothetical protein